MSNATEVLIDQELVQNGIMTSETFSLEVERRYAEDPDPQKLYLSHASDYMESLGIDAGDGKKLLSPALLDKIRHEALTRNMLKEKNTTYSLF